MKIDAATAPHLVTAVSTSLLLAGCFQPEADPGAAIRAAHIQQRRAHVEARPELMLATFASDFRDLTRGEAAQFDSIAWLDGFTAYVEGSTFTAWDDAAPAEIEISPDGSVARAIVQKRVHRRFVEDGIQLAEAVRYSWLETWRLEDGHWRIAAVASTSRPEPMAPADTREAFRIGSEGLLAEGIDFDPHTGSTFIGSARRGLVLRRTASGVVDTLPLGELGGVLGLRVDRVHNRLWVAAADFPARAGYDAARDTLTEIVIFDLESEVVIGRAARRRHEDWDAYNDIAVDRDGIALVTGFGFGDVTEMEPDGSERRRWRIPGAYTNGIALDSDERYAWVSTGEGLVRIDRTDDSVATVIAPPGIRLGAIDGLYRLGEDLLAIHWVYGGGGPANRIVRIAMAGPTRVAGIAVILDDPEWISFATTGAVIGDSVLRVIANAQFDLTDDTGMPLPDAQLSETRIVDVPLR